MMGTVPLIQIQAGKMVFARRRNKLHTGKDRDRSGVFSREDAEDEEEEEENQEDQETAEDAALEGWWYQWTNGSKKKCLW